MRNQILERVDELLRALGSEALEREQVAAKLSRLKLTKDQLGNLLLDLEELGWIEKRHEEKYRIGSRLAAYWRNAMDRDRAEMMEIYHRSQHLYGRVSWTADLWGRDKEEKEEAASVTDSSPQRDAEERSMGQPGEYERGILESAGIQSRLQGRI